jgi:hypothetical protein
MGDWLANRSVGDTVSRFDALQDTLEGLMQLVAIQLDGDDRGSGGVRNAQLARRRPHFPRPGQEQPAEQARRDGSDIADLYNHAWYPNLGDADYWLEEIRQGRYTSPRSDLFLMHWLTMKTGKAARGWRKRWRREGATPLS